MSVEPGRASDASSGFVRAIGLPHATAMVVGTIIGASIFVQPSEVTGRVPSVGGIILVWVVAGLLTLFGALVCAELASTFRRSGGVYVYLREGFGPAAGFLWGWAMYWVMHSGIIAAIAVVFARYVEYFAPLGEGGRDLVAVGAILVLSAVNYRGVRGGARLQAGFTAGKLVAILGIIVAVALFGGVGGGAGDVTATPPGRPWGWTDFALAVGAGLFAFGGWHMVTYASDETVEPERTIPRALGWGVLIVTVVYVLLNAVYLLVLPLDTVARSTRVAADAADAVFGGGGGAFMSGLVLFSSFGALSGIVLAGPRVYYAMGRDGLLFRSVATLHPRFGTPHRAIVLQAVWSSVLVMTGTYGQLVGRVIYTEWIFFALLALGLMRLRRRSDLSPAYRVWGYPWIPILFATASLAIVANQIWSDPGDSALGLGVVLLGLPVYKLWTLRSSSRVSPS